MDPRKIFFLVTFRSIYIGIFPFVLHMWPKKRRDILMLSSTTRREKIQISPYDYEYRKMKVTYTVTWLMFEIVVSAWIRTLAGKMYPRGYHFEKDPQWVDRHRKYVELEL